VYIGRHTVQEKVNYIDFRPDESHIAESTGTINEDFKLGGFVILSVTSHGQEYQNGN
jgi:hypothetical protein